MYLLILMLGGCTANLFHEGSKTVFLPNQPALYFGYSILLRNTKPMQLIIGAPKAKNLVSNMTTGVVFTCPLENITSSVTCSAIKFSSEREGDPLYRYSRAKDFMKEDMWFGAALAAVGNGSLLVTAPRWYTPHGSKHYLANGLCYAISKKHETVLMPLNDMRRQAFITDGKRKEYGEYGVHLNFYAYGQVGMSIEVTDDQKTLLLGAPGILQWTGGIINIQLLGNVGNVDYFNKQQTNNPYFTKQLGPDDYFGYSVDSGVFEPKGKTFFIAGAPRSHSGFGQVIIFEPPILESSPLIIQAIVTGPQLGAYFGSSICSTDLNGDGRSDLLIGAPNYIKIEGDLPFDQGAVFVYLTKKNGTGFMLKRVGIVTGSGMSSSRFGTSIATLGDVDGDGYPEIAIGAPWENDGVGVVYIYRGNAYGLHDEYIQRITVPEARGFGIAIAKGVDVDSNGCNDLAVGAYDSATAYVFRCIPTIKVSSVINVPDEMDLPQNATNFTAQFCVNVSPAKSWPHAKLNLKVEISVDHEGGRVMLSGENEYTVEVKPGEEACNEQIVEVNSHADLSRPILLSLNLKAADDLYIDTSLVFPENLARLSKDSELSSVFEIQLTRDCGEDLICNPLLKMTLSSLSNNPYIPGLGEKFGAQIFVINVAEPAYGAKIHLYLPSTPIRVPSSCVLKAQNMTCAIPAPLHRNENVTWLIELEYTQNSTDEVEMSLIAKLYEPLEFRSDKADIEKELVLKVLPKANITVNGKVLPNNTMSVTRKALNEGGYITFVHFFEITNYGPSDWPLLGGEFILSEKIFLYNKIQDCVQFSERLQCAWFVPANASIPIVLQLKFNFTQEGELLREQEILNITTSVFLKQHNVTVNITTTLVLDAATPVWPLVVGTTLGLILLSGITHFLYKRGFFSRRSREELRRLQESSSSPPAGQTSSEPTSSEIVDESLEGLLCEDSD